MKKIKPPRLAEKLLLFFLREELAEEVLGDLDEKFYATINKQSLGKANRNYWYQVLKYMRPFAFRNFGSNHRLNHYDMFKNYLKTSMRSLGKNTLFSSINIVGLAIGMSVGILMIILLSELYSFDDFHAQKDNIYRVTSSRAFLGEERYYTTSSFYIGSELMAQVPGVENVLIMGRNMRADLKTEEDAIPVNGYYATASFFDVFSFKLKKGNPQTALADHNGIVLTESTSKKLFGDSDPIGELVAVNGNSDFLNGIITGVLEDPPQNSHIQFEALVSMKTLEKSVERQEANIRNDAGGIYNSYVYLVLKHQASKEEVEYALSKLVADHNSEAENSITHLLQPLNTFVTSDTYLNGTGPSFAQSRINVMIGLTFIVLLSACFNYTNLSLARALRRSKEVAVRHVTGANRFQIFAQFQVEAVILALIALAVALGLFSLIKPGFLNLPNPAAKGYQMFLLDFTYIQLLYFFLFAIGVGCLAGFLPATFLSKLKARHIFNDASKIIVFSGINLRRLLIVFQFALSIGLIMCAVLVHHQYQFAVNYNLGYATDNIVHVILKGDYANLLESEYAKLPEVTGTSKSSLVLGVGSATMGIVQSEDQAASSYVLVNEIDENYLHMHEFQILAGSGFLSQLVENEIPQHIVVNEEVLKALDLGSPQEAIGKSIWRNQAKLRIIGVVGSFVNFSLNAKLENAFAFIQTNRTNEYQYLGVKIKGNDLSATIGRLQESYQVIDPVHPFEATFYNDQIAKTYQPEKTIYTIISFLAFLAISISTLGLLGMAVFTIESRTKEISIRKVLGAGVGNLVMQLSQGFLAMIVLAGLIAIPITLYIVDDIILNEFIYKAKIGLMEIFSGFVIVLMIGILTIGWQIRETAVQNPANLLRNE